MVIIRIASTRVTSVITSGIVTSSVTIVATAVVMMVIVSTSTQSRTNNDAFEKSQTKKDTLNFNDSCGDQIEANNQCQRLHFG